MGQFDDVQRAPTLLTKAPKEKKELDENKSKKGLAELYEDEYAQKTGLVSAALSFSEEQKEEASMLFKKLCVKLDALSHFHFAPKPVIEDMSIQANVPALAIEEVAPLAVSDAAMLAPEELFSSKGDIKEETELTKTDRNRRRAKKKRQFKAKSAKQMAVKAQLNTLKKPADNAVTVFRLQDLGAPSLRKRMKKELTSGEAEEERYMLNHNRGALISASHTPVFGLDFTIVNIIFHFCRFIREK